MTRLYWCIPWRIIFSEPWRDPSLAQAAFTSLPVVVGPLHVAAYWGWVETAKALIAEGVNISEFDSHGCSPIIWASSTGRGKILELLIGHGVDVNSKDAKGWTPLFWAAIKSNREVVSLLLEKGADPLITDSNSWTALHWASSKGDKHIVDLLLQHDGGLPSGKVPRPLFMGEITEKEPVKTIKVKDTSVSQASIFKKSLTNKYSEKPPPVPMELSAEAGDRAIFDVLWKNAANMEEKNISIYSAVNSY